MDKRTIILLIAYVIGVIACYKIVKYEIVKQYNDGWSREDLIFALWFSSFSWIGVIVFFIVSESLGEEFKD